MSECDARHFGGTAEIVCQGKDHDGELGFTEEFSLLPNCLQEQ
jgi:hypothetical protein